MTVLREFVITIGSGLGFAGVGGLIGQSIGNIAPDYYRALFRLPPAVDPVAFGTAIGIVQGFGAGLVIGLVIVITVAWYNSRLMIRSY